ncbi:hypothetical protein MBH78_16485 [Oceanimonas sp. NS1]|nr:hypothetical protein [Oceanimonas sp. NS1]
MDHLGGRLAGPGHQPGRVDVGMQLHVAFGPVDVVIVGPVTVHGLQKDIVGQTHATFFQKLAGRQYLAPGIAGKVGQQAFHLGDGMLLHPLAQPLHIAIFRILNTHSEALGEKHTRQHSPYWCKSMLDIDIGNGQEKTAFLPH